MSVAACASEVERTGEENYPAIPAPRASGSPPLPGRLTFQWHVTERCNLRCTHCYQEDYHGAELSFDQWLAVLDQLEALLADWDAAHGGRTHAHLNLTGGEPFAHPDFLRLLETVAARRPRLSFAVLSNGTLVDAALARALTPLRPEFVQVSLEGRPATHDRIRGAGSFARAAAAVRQLTAARVPVLLAFTAHRENFREFPAVAELACRWRVQKVWADRFIPAGSGAEHGLASLTPTEAREFFTLLRAARAAAQRRWFCRTEVAQHRALQFLTGDASPYRCTAGDSLLTLLPNGDLLPCRRLPLPVGNVLRTPLRELYRESAILRALREPRRVAAGCEPCAFRHTCGGGLRCLAFALRGDPFTSDPGCWLARPGAEATAADPRLD